MSADREIEQWLQAQPLDEPIEIDGEYVYLKPRLGGAELGAILIENPGPIHLEQALKLGFQGATQFDAGLALGSDGSTLVLSQWLPQVHNWPQAAGALERLLNQVSMFRAAFSPTPIRQGQRDERHQEQRLRMHFAGENHEKS